MRCGYCEIGYLACPKCGDESLAVDLVEQYCPSCGVSLLLDMGEKEIRTSELEIKALKAEIVQLERIVNAGARKLRATEIKLDALGTLQRNMAASERSRQLQQLRSELCECREKLREHVDRAEKEKIAAITVDPLPGNHRVKLFSNLDGKTGEIGRASCRERV